LSVTITRRTGRVFFISLRKKRLVAALFRRLCTGTVSPAP